MEDVYTKLIDLPTRVRGYTVRDKNGDYAIVINARLSQEDRIEAYQHEIKHIKNSDFQRVCRADLIEIFAHQ